MLVHDGCGIDALLKVSKQGRFWWRNLSRWAHLFLKQGNFHKIFKDENSRPRMSERGGKTWPALHATFFNTMREHLTCLCNQLLTMKTGEDYQPRLPKLKFPKYIKKNFRKLVWDIDETDQPEINRYQSWYNGNSKDLNNLLNCTNPVIRIPEETFLEDEEDDGKSEEQSGMTKLNSLTLSL